MEWFPGEGWMNRKSTKDFLGSEIILYDRTMVIRVIVHLSKLIEYTPRVNPTTNYEL